MTGVTVEFTFPFGRYAATPWFRSRREHVENVEWPPSPWRLGRALLAQAHRTLVAEDLEEAAAIALRLARSPPDFSFREKTGSLAYAQWMPGLSFDDGNPGAGRVENGHFLLDLGVDDPLVVAWPDLDLEEAERALLATLVADLPYLGQSVSVTDARLVTEPRESGPWIKPAVGEAEIPVRRVLIATEACSVEELGVETGRDPTLKGQAAPPGAHWIAYEAVTPGRRRRTPPRREARDVRSIWVSFDGPLRPPVPRPDDPPQSALDAGGLAAALGRALRQGLDKLGQPTGLPSIEHVRLVDSDGDGRAELAEVSFSRTPSREELGRLDHVGLDGGVHQDGRTIWRWGCELRFEGFAPGEALAGVRDAGRRAATPEPELLHLGSRSLPLVADALRVGEAVHRAILSRAGASFGADRIPWVLSGRLADGAVRRTERGQHAHRHVVPGSTDGTTIDRLALWAPAGFTAAERAVLRGLWLPPLAGARVHVYPADAHPSVASARSWSTLTPFLPVRFPKRRDGTVSEAIVRQVEQELHARGLPAATVGEITAARGFRVLRSRAPRRANPPGAYHVTLEFETPVSGPICLGRDGHFGMGTFVPR